MIQAKFQEEKLKLQQKHDGNVQKVGPTSRLTSSSRRRTLAVDTSSSKLHRNHIPVHVLNHFATMCIK